MQQQGTTTTDHCTWGNGGGGAAATPCGRGEAWRGVAAAEQQKDLWFKRENVGFEKPMGRKYNMAASHGIP